MTMTFYLGQESKDIRKKFEKIKRYYSNHLNQGYSNSDCFRFIVNLLYNEILRVEGLK